MKSQVLYIGENMDYDRARAVIVHSYYAPRAVSHLNHEDADVAEQSDAYARIAAHGCIMPQVVGHRYASPAWCRLWRMRGHKPTDFDHFYAAELKRREHLAKYVTYTRQPEPVKARDIRKAYKADTTGRAYGRV